MYDTEMKSYLHNEDVIPSNRKKGLASYLQPIDAALAGVAGTKRKRDNEDDTAGPSRKTYRSDALPGLSLILLVITCCQRTIKSPHDAMPLPFAMSAFLSCHSCLSFDFFQGLLAANGLSVYKVLWLDDWLFCYMPN